MLYLEHQNGSSTVGLLTASAIFVALLVYANQFAFNDRNNEDSKSVDVQPQNTKPHGGDKSAPIVATEGVISKPKLQSSTSELALAEIDEAPTQAAAVKVQPQDSASSVASQSTMLANVTHWNPYPSYYPAYYGSADQAAMNYTNDYSAGLNNAQQLDAYVRANNRANGRGNMDGDADFTFTMNFKSRARMDANTDFDTDIDTYANAYQQHLYNQNAVYQPNYGYNYYRY